MAYSVEEWSKNTTKHKEVNYIYVFMEYTSLGWLLKNGTPYHDSDTFVEP